jgi:5-methylcytosine-specific restriction enzyme A
MPTSPPMACPCGGRRASGQPCDRCGKGGKREAQRAYDRERGSAAARGYDWRWRNPDRTGAADRFLAEHPLCVACEAEDGRCVAATVVDHIVPHRGDMELFWDVTNWQSLCEHHHNAKTAKGE